MRVDLKQYNQVWKTHILLSDYAAARLAANPDEHRTTQGRYTQALLKEIEDTDSLRAAETEPVDPSMQKVFQISLLSEEICHQVNQALEKRDLAMAQRLVFGSPTSLAIYGKYIVPACQRVQAIIQESSGQKDPLPPDIVFQLKIAKYYQQEFESGAGEDWPVVLEVLQSSADPADKARQLMSMCNRFLIAGQLERIEQILDAVDELAPSLPPDSKPGIWQDYDLFCGDLAFLRGEDAAGLAAYTRAGFDLQDPEAEYYHFHVRPRRHLALLERVVRAILE